MTRIAVLMTCFNRVETTLRCLHQLVTQKLPDGYAIDIWLVDDGSPDGTGEKVESWGRHTTDALHVIRSKGGLFWCKGMRLAWDAATCPARKGTEAKEDSLDFFLWLNDDVVLKEGAIAGLIEDYEKVGGVIVGTFSSEASEKDVSYGATSKMPDGMPHRGEKGMNGNLVLVPREVYEKIGPICGSYHHQYGDFDYGWLLRRGGFEFYSSSRFCGFCPEQPERYYHLNDRSLWSRWKLMFDPKGYSLHDAFLYSWRNKGKLRALLTVAHVFLVVTFAKEDKE